jgi:threonine/homoserine efflux transporter RhtA
MNPTTIAALIQAVISLGVVIFQLALAAGAPWAEYTMGGQTKGRLPRSLRIGATLSAVIMLAQAGHYLAQAGVIPRLLDSTGNNVVNWIWFGFSIAGLILNSISRSKKERNTWVPVLLASSVCTLLVALN